VKHRVMLVGIVLAVGSAVAVLLIPIWKAEYPSLEIICAAAANEPAPVTPAGKQAAFSVMFACRYGDGASWARSNARDNLGEWRRAESASPPPAHSSADIIERRLYGPDQQ
jgi:hypothetical protein